MNQEHTDDLAQEGNTNPRTDGAQDAHDTPEAAEAVQGGPQNAAPRRRPPADSRWLAYVALLMAGLAILVSVYVLQQAQAYDKRIMDTVDSLRRLDAKYGNKLAEVDERLFRVEAEQRLFLKDHYQAYLELINVRLAVLAKAVKPADREIIDDFMRTLKKIKIEGRYDKE